MRFPPRKTGVGDEGGGRKMRMGSVSQLARATGELKISTRVRNNRRTFLIRQARTLFSDNVLIALPSRRQEPPSSLVSLDDSRGQKL